MTRYTLLGGKFHEIHKSIDTYKYTTLTLSPNHVCLSLGGIIGYTNEFVNSIKLTELTNSFINFCSNKYSCDYKINITEDLESIMDQVMYVYKELKQRLKLIMKIGGSIESDMQTKMDNEKGDYSIGGYVLSIGGDDDNVEFGRDNTIIIKLSDNFISYVRSIIGKNNKDSLAVSKKAILIIGYRVYCIIAKPL